MQIYKAKPCQRCGEIFRPHSANHQYCSERCKRPRARCEQCGKDFSVGKKAAGRFCSLECFYEWERPTGSRFVDESTGYVLIKVPKGTHGVKVSRWGSRWMYEHRFVMQRKLGRALEKHEHVHHLNGRRDDNRRTNLELWKGAHPRGVRSADYHCPGCRCFD